MTKQFSIKKICSEEIRPPYSYKVEAYFEEFVHDNILKPFDIILKEEWRTILSIMIFKKDELNPEGVSFYEPDLLEEEKVKFYPISILLEDIYKNDAHMENIVSLYFQVISLFFISHFKSITSDYMVALKDKLDWDYLLSLPYPAHKDEQHYVGD